MPEPSDYKSFVVTDVAVRPFRHLTVLTLASAESWKRDCPHYMFRLPFRIYAIKPGHKIEILAKDFREESLASSPSSNLIAHNYYEQVWIADSDSEEIMTLKGRDLATLCTRRRKEEEKHLEGLLRIRDISNRQRLLS
ncbi:MAG TPA: hypothetical protein VJB94_00545 [Candidatus Nanoarchaeia archaeon]|nr:hypothetical protein [Candidatus Nanoarchaeia archaeon]